MSTAVSVPETAPRPAPWDAWAQKMAFATQLVSTGFLPSAIKTPAQALAIILTGQELGLPPMHALRSIHVIQGKPGLSAELMLALMLRGGVVLTWGESTDTGATLTAKREQTAFTGTFTLEDAKRANLVGKDGWKNYPAAMLRARVIALVARVVAPDLIAGLYTPEELGADVDAEGAIVSAPPSPDPVELERVPTVGASSDIAPVEDWVRAFEAVESLNACLALWRGVTHVETWSSFNTDEQATITTAKDVAKARLTGEVHAAR